MVHGKWPNSKWGELSEWSKEPHSKCGIRITSYRGFESLTLRKENEKDVRLWASFFFNYLELMFGTEIVDAHACFENG